MADRRSSCYNSCNRHKELSFFVLFIKINSENNKFERSPARKHEGIFFAFEKS